MHEQRLILGLISSMKYDLTYLFEVPLINECYLQQAMLCNMIEYQPQLDLAATFVYRSLLKLTHPPTQ